MEEEDSNIRADSLDRRRTFQAVPLAPPLASDEFVVFVNRIKGRSLVEEQLEVGQIATTAAIVASSYA
eukprot:3883471-Pyramimonas_sp.AAC.1